jgi:hypothetical protein
MDSVPLYSAEQISVPESLPRVLKEFAKEAIRASPADLLAWSVACVARRRRRRRSRLRRVSTQRTTPFGTPPRDPRYFSRLVSARLVDEVDDAAPTIVSTETAIDAEPALEDGSAGAAPTAVASAE